MTRTLSKLVLGAALVILVSPPDIFAGRGGGYRGGGGGGYGGGNRGGGTGGTPSFSQARPPMNQSGGSGNRSSYGNQAQSGAHPQYGNTSGAANQNLAHPNADSAAAGAGYANRNQSQNLAHPDADAAAAGAGYANRNQGSAYPYAGAAAGAGAAYANNNPYNQYHPGMVNGSWNGNNYPGWGATGYGSGVGAWGTGSPMYGYGYSGYGNPYAGSMSGAGAGQPGALAQPSGAPAYDYRQPLNTAAAPPKSTATDRVTAVFDQARGAFKSNDYATALERDQQALGQMPNDATMHEFLALVLFAQGKYEQAAAPLYAVLSLGPGWDWTTLIGNYTDANVYTEQLRSLEAYAKGNPSSAQAQFVLAYHYIAQGHGEAAASQLKTVVALQPNDRLSAQLLTKLQPAGAGSAAPPAPPQSPPFDAGKLTGNWVAQGPQNSTISLSIKDGGGFTWAVALPDKPPRSITGASTVADGVLTLAGGDSQAGALSGQVAWQDDTHFSFRAVGAPADDPGLKFAR